MLSTRFSESFEQIMLLQQLLKDDPVSPRGPGEAFNQGDVFWIRADNPDEAKLGFYPHPYVVIQDNIFNHSRIQSVVVCALTTNLKQANAPGNVLLEAGEANLPKQSAVVVSKVSAVDKSRLGDYIGTLSQQRIKQILAGMRFLQASFLAR
jgi:mRNA interferase MazF